jgi:uncharacterized integral membrane protein
MNTLILALILMILLVFFVLQNAEIITVQLWFWQIEASLALILTSTLLLGAIIALLVFLPALYKKNSDINTIRKQMKQKESEPKAVSEKPTTDSHL